MKTGIELITIERQEQIEKHHRTVEYDVIHNDNEELTDAVLAILQGDYELFSIQWSDALCDRIMSKTWKEKLTIAGALIAAEIDRLQHPKT